MSQVAIEDLAQVGKWYAAAQLHGGTRVQDALMTEDMQALRGRATEWLACIIRDEKSNSGDQHPTENCQPAATAPLLYLNKTSTSGFVLATG